MVRASVVTCLVLASLMTVTSVWRSAETASNPDQAYGGEVPRSSWCSLYEGDGVSSPSTEGWTVRPFGGTTITAGVSDGATVATVNDPTTGNGAWIQRFMDFEQPFVISARGRYDPSTSYTGLVHLIYVFTGNHTIGASIFPTYIRIDAIPIIYVPAVQGTWHNVTFDAKAPLDVDVYVDGALVGNVEMRPADLIIWDQPLNKPAILAIGTLLQEKASGMVDYIRTTMCPPKEIPPKKPDRIPPEIRNVTFDDGVQPPANVLTVPYGIATKVWLNATIDDSRMKNSTIWSVNYSMMPRTWPGVRMYPVDGKLDWPVEDVTALIDISTFPLGGYDYCVYARDYQGPKNLTGACGTLIIAEVFNFEVRVSYSETECHEGTCDVHFEIDTNDRSLVRFRWDIDDDGTWDTAWLSGRTYDISDYGDDYGGRVCAEGSDGLGRIVDSCTGYEVRNVPPEITAMVVSEVRGGLRLRVAGEKWHDVTATLYLNGAEYFSATVLRMPGSPDDQAVALGDVTLDLMSADSWSAKVVYTPLDDLESGEVWGADPAWLIFTLEQGNESRLHHTFNVRHDDTWIWIVPDLRSFLVGMPLEFEATATDPGSDDLTFTWDWGDGTPATATTYYNDGLGPDPYPSPAGVSPFTATDVRVRAFTSAGTYAVILKVSDDDGGSMEMTLILVLAG